MSNADTILKSTGMVTDTLSDMEFFDLHESVTTGKDPRQAVYAYRKAKTLFSEQGGTRMPTPVLNAFKALYSERFGGDEQ